MFDVGFSEMFLVFVIALIIIGPERLPAVARKVGLFIRKTKSAFQQITQEVQKELDTEELNKKLAENNILPDTKDIKKEFQDIKNELEDTNKKA